MSDTDTPATPGPPPFGVRLDAATLARLDAYAGRIGRKRGGAAAVALAAGLDALDGLPVTAPPVGHPAPSSGPPAVLDVDALAEVLRRLDALAVAVAELPERVPQQVYRRKGKERREGPTRPDASIGRRDEDKPQP